MRDTSIEWLIRFAHQSVSKPKTLLQAELLLLRLRFDELELPAVQITQVKVEMESMLLQTDSGILLSIPGVGGYGRFWIDYGNGWLVFGIHVLGKETILQNSEYKQQLYAQEYPFPRTEGSGEWIFDIYAVSGIVMNYIAPWERITNRDN